MPIRQRPQFGDRDVHVARQRGHAPLQIRLQNRQARFSALDTALRRGRRRDAHVGEVRRLLAELPRRLLVKLSKRAPLVFDGALELIFLLSPEMERGDEPIDLGLQLGEALFETGL